MKKYINTQCFKNSITAHNTLLNKIRKVALSANIDINNG